MGDTYLIALDWGTTSLRAYRFDADGQVVEVRHRPSGILRIEPAGFERALDDACGDWLAAAPASAVVACGMIGSAQGWREAPYLEVPTSLDALGRALTPVKTQRGVVLHIIPGLIARGALPEVMRGEETQVAGATEVANAANGGSIDGGPEPHEGAVEGPGTWVCLPGTHAKWVRLQGRRILRFHTFMTGEVFAALCAHTLLGRTMKRPANPDLDAFDRGVEVARSPAGRAGVLSTIFSTRTLGLVGVLPAESQADYLSGLLIGHEIAGVERIGDHLGAADPGSVVLVGGDELCQRYQRALAAFGHAPAVIAADATARGLWRVARSAGLVPGSRAGERW
ncbi:MAG TPA: 2-dehydro-3-deoxygalactonokinase [Kofleriaceae bacterium]|nr:2-dehydro-3-deoxygalactonokinase [Kofleriaceae bacterium]